MKLQTKIPLKPERNQIDYQSQLLLLGSCFTENIGIKFDYFKFQSVQNPFGILFHPVAIENLIEKAIRQKKYIEKDIFFLNERWHCFDVHSDLSNPSKENLLEKLNKRLEEVHQQITTSTHISITLGTAWTYRHTKTDDIVANCHKIPQKEFSKELLSVDTIRKSLENTTQNILSINKDVQFIFTVSPVRHLKDGFIENQRSKAHLITAIHDIISHQRQSRGLSYFPSYEIMMDELRDYRFYETDMVHPNQLAIDYIWEKFSAIWIASKAQLTMEKVEAIRKGLQHRPFNSDSEEHQRFLKSLEEKITYLKQEYGFMYFDV